MIRGSAAVDSRVDKVKENSGRKFLSGVSVLTLSALIVKVIGLLYKIPLLSYLGTEGMGYFNTAYELYALFCVISTAGLPVAMSVLISGGANLKMCASVNKIYRVALYMFVFIGASGSLLMFGFSSGFAALLKNEGAVLCMRAISPTVFFICLSSAYRGYFQGCRNMIPTAASQVIEAAGKLVLGLVFAKYALSQGYSAPVTAAYAVLGLTVGTVVSAVYLAVHKFVWDRRRGCTVPPTMQDRTCRSSDIFRALLVTAIPVTLSAGVIGVTKFVDLAMILRRLQDFGYSEGEANSLYGCYSTLVLPVFNILPSLASSVSLSAVPTLSAAIRKGREGQRELRSTGCMALTVTSLVAVPAAVGLAVFSKDILFLIFSNEAEAVDLAYPWLSWMAMAVVPACMITVSTGMLQASGHASASLCSILIGIGVKIVLAYYLIGLEGVGLVGAPISSVVCDTVAAVINFACVKKYSPGMLPGTEGWLKILFLPLALSFGAILSVYYIRHILKWNEISNLRTIASIVTVVLIYGAALLSIMAINRKNKVR